MYENFEATRGLFILFLGDRNCIQRQYIFSTKKKKSTLFLTRVRSKLFFVGSFIEYGSIKIKHSQLRSIKVGRSVAQLVGWSVGWLVGRSVGRLVGRSVGRSVHRLVRQSPLWYR